VLIAAYDVAKETEVHTGVTRDHIQCFDVLDQEMRECVVDRVS
jgi:hypothetical protein